jgi:hypothetical protein
MREEAELTNAQASIRATVIERLEGRNAGMPTYDSLFRVGGVVMCDGVDHQIEHDTTGLPMFERKKN